MRTSRVAKDTARVMQQLASPPSRRQTRSSLTSSEPKARAKSSRASRKPNPGDALSDDVSSPSSGTPDIEDAPFIPESTSTRKRKRDEQPPPQRHRRRPAAVIKGEINSDSDAVTPKRESPSATTPATTVTATATTITSSTRAFPRPPKAQPATEVSDAAGNVTVHAPPGWEAMWDACAAMRARRLAPVDTMGCDRLFDRASSPLDQRFQTLIALMLSPQTKDTVTAGAMARLHAALAPRGGFSLAAVLELDPAELDRLIIPVGFHNTKTRNIQRAAALLRERHGGDVPCDLAALQALPGVGPKIAHLCLQAAWSVTEGIGVDVHVHRITNRWGWHRTQGPEQTRLALQRWLPRDRWAAINHMLVGFGQTTCAPVGPRCGECDLAERGLCPAAVKPKVKKQASVLVTAAGGARATAAVKKVEETAEGMPDGVGLVAKVEVEETVIKREE